MDSTGGELRGGISSVMEDGKINANQDTSEKIEHTQNSHVHVHIYYVHIHTYTHTHILHIQDVLYNIKSGVCNTMNHNQLA